MVALLGSVMRTLEPVDRPLDPQRWAELRGRRSTRPQMSEMTLGILGLGRIGRRVARLGSAIGFARVIYNDLAAIPPNRRHGALPVPVEQLFAQSDALTIHIDGRPSNRHYIGQALIELMGPTVVFINTSRGLVVDGRVLASFLRSRPGAVALLDVHDPEPFGADYPLLGLQNARLFPHAASSTRLADLNMSWVVRDIVAVLSGRQPRFRAP
jgi:phosphoglycerate dehydrogenase-like enzyme